MYYNYGGSRANYIFHVFMGVSVAYVYKSCKLRVTCHNFCQMNVPLLLHTMSATSRKSVSLTYNFRGILSLTYFFVTRVEVAGVVDKRLDVSDEFLPELRLYRDELRGDLGA